MLIKSRYTVFNQTAALDFIFIFLAFSLLLVVFSLVDQENHSIDKKLAVPQYE